MAFEFGSGKAFTLPAAADLRLNQFCLLVENASGQWALPTAAGQLCDAVLQNLPNAAGQAADGWLLGLGGISKGRSDGSVDTVGTHVSCAGANGQFRKSTGHPGDNILGTAMEVDGGVVGAIITIMLNAAGVQ